MVYWMANMLAGFARTHTQLQPVLSVGGAKHLRAQQHYSGVRGHLLLEGSRPRKDDLGVAALLRPWPCCSQEALERPLQRHGCRGKPDARTTGCSDLDCVQSRPSCDAGRLLADSAVCLEVWANAKF